jgi:hypothetical protein
MRRIGISAPQQKFERGQRGYWQSLWNGNSLSKSLSRGRLASGRLVADDRKAQRVRHVVRKIAEQFCALPHFTSRRAWGEQVALALASPDGGYCGNFVAISH